jgi:hypothetical protein
MNEMSNNLQSYSVLLKPAWRKSNISIRDNIIIVDLDAIGFWYSGFVKCMVLLHELLTAGAVVFCARKYSLGFVLMKARKIICFGLAVFNEAPKV